MTDIGKLRETNAHLVFSAGGMSLVKCRAHLNVRFSTITVDKGMDEREV